MKRDNFPESEESVRDSKRAKKSLSKKQNGNKAKPKSVMPKKTKKIVKLSSKTVNYSLCIPTSILDNCSNLEQITHTVYQIAKSATIFNAAEIVILDLGERKSARKSTLDNQNDHKQATQIKIRFDEVAEKQSGSSAASERQKEQKKKLSPAMLIASLLQYFVTPPYLVNSVFKKSYLECFQVAAKLPRLSALPFMRHLKDDHGRYREGLAIRMHKPGTNKKDSKRKPYEQTKYVNVGKGENLELRGQLVPANVRVTVDVIERKVVSPEEAYGDFVGAKTSFGYHVRVAKSFADVFTACPAPQGYTQTVWVNSGDYYFNPDLKKTIKIDSKIPHIQKIIKPTSEEDIDVNDTTPANLLVMFGRWNHISDSFKQSREQFEGCEGAFQFFDGQLDLPGSSPLGNICIEDSCMIALATLANY